MKQYLLSVCYPAGSSAPPPEVLQEIREDVEAVAREMKAAGVWVYAGALLPADTAAVVRVEDGRVLTTDGPFIESKELVGGICIVNAADRDEALAWGARMSRAARVPIEVRPFQPHGVT